MNHKYPQSIWAKRAPKYLNSIIKEGDKIIDAPSGNGIFSFWLKKELNEQKYLLLDIDQSSISVAKQNGFDAKVFDFSKDLYVFERQKIWLFINSLYCLDCPDDAMNIIKSNCEYLFAVFPDINSSTYRSFIKNNPKFTNPKAMSIEDTIKYVESFGFRCELKEGASYFNFHKMNKILGRFSYKANFCYFLYSLFDNLKKMVGGKPNYYFILFRNEN